MNKTKIRIMKVNLIQLDKYGLTFRFKNKEGLFTYLERI
jgi:hypothetical protein